jgi:8-oxo-dGTP diphosphatase
MGAHHEKPVLTTDANIRSKLRQAYKLSTIFLFMALKAFIRKEDKYLVLLRGKRAPTYPLHWDLPGGGSEEGEDGLKAVLREIKEETDLTVKDVRKDAEFDITADNEKLHYIIFTAEYVSGDVLLSFEHRDFQWATKEEILQLKIEPFLAHYLK